MTVRKQTINQSNHDFGLLGVIAGVIGIITLLVYLGSSIDYHKYIDRTDGLIPVYTMPFNLSVTADGGVEVSLPTNNLGLPDLSGFNHCLEINECEWKARVRTTTIDGDETVVIEAELKEAGQTIGRVQHMRINPAEYEQLWAISEQGHQWVWVSHIEVYEPLWGNGIGHALWRAGDIFLKLFAGSGAVHVFADQAGWGPSIMKNVPADRIILQGEQLWAYLIH